MLKVVHHGFLVGTVGVCVAVPLVEIRVLLCLLHLHLICLLLLDQEPLGALALVCISHGLWVLFALALAGADGCHFDIVYTLLHLMTTPDSLCLSILRHSKGVTLLDLLLAAL